MYFVDFYCGFAFGDMCRFSADEEQKSLGINMIQTPQANTTRDETQTVKTLSVCTSLFSKIKKIFCQTLQSKEINIL